MYFGVTFPLKSFGIQKENELNLHSILQYLMDFVCLSYDFKSPKARARSYFYQINCLHNFLNFSKENFNLK